MFLIPEFFTRSVVDQFPALSSQVLLHYQVDLYQKDLDPLGNNMTGQHTWFLQFEHGATTRYYKLFQTFQFQRENYGLQFDALYFPTSFLHTLQGSYLFCDPIRWMRSPGLWSSFHILELPFLLYQYNKCQAIKKHQGLRIGWASLQLTPLFYNLNYCTPSPSTPPPLPHPSIFFICLKVQFGKLSKVCIRFCFRLFKTKLW